MQLKQKDNSVNARKIQIKINSSWFQQENYSKRLRKIRKESDGQECPTSAACIASVCLFVCLVS